MKTTKTSTLQEVVTPLLLSDLESKRGDWRFPLGNLLWVFRDRPEYKGQPGPLIEDLNELTAWTYEDLLRLDGVGPVKASAIERCIARYGLLLKDGNPALLEAARQDAEVEETLKQRLNGDNIVEFPTAEASPEKGA